MSNPRDLVPCSYLGEKGPCTKMCYRGRCHIHKNRASLALCTRCGERGTSSKTGICATIATGCRWHAQHAARRMKAEAEMDRHIAALIESIYGTGIEPPCPPQTPAAGATPAA